MYAQFLIDRRVSLGHRHSSNFGSQSGLGVVLCFLIGSYPRVDYSSSCLSMKLSKAAETQRMSHRGFQSLCHIRVRTVQLPPTSL